jgi:hypothetical protein
MAEIPNCPQDSPPTGGSPISKPGYDLEERTFLFAKTVRVFVKSLPKTIANIEDGRQLIKASGSIGANYREALENAHDAQGWLQEANNWNLGFVCNLVLGIWNFPIPV